MTRIGNWFVFFSFLFSSLAASGVVSVQTSLDRRQVRVGEPFVFTVSVISNEDMDIQDPRPPDLEGFEVIETWQGNAVSRKLAPGPNGMEFQTQVIREFNYRLRARAAGRHSIGAFELSVNGKMQVTQPLVVEVTDGPPGGRGSGGGGGTPPGWPPGFGPDADPFEALDRAEEELFKQLLQRGNPGRMRPPPQHRTLPVNPNEAFFIQVEVDKTEVYEGEQILVSWYLYTRGHLETVDRVKFPDLRGFWKEIIEEVPALQFTEEIVNGVPFRKALLAAHALFPLKAGTAVVDEYKVKSRVRLQQGGFGGFGQAREYTKSSQRVSIKVKPLPLEGRPSTFTGAVGNFQVSMQVDAAQVPVNQPMTVRVRFEGIGNAKAIELPVIDWPKSFEQYDSKSQSQYFKDGRSYKQFDLLVIPRAEGTLEIPGLSFAMFNPQTGNYETKTTSPIQINVGPAIAGATPAPSGPAAPSAPSAPAVVEDRLPDPIHAYTSASAVTQLGRSPVLWCVLYALVFAVLAFKAKIELFGRNFRRDIHSLLNKKYKVIDAAIRAGQPRKVGAEMLNVLSMVVGELVGEAGATDPIDKMMERVPPSVRRDYGAEILKRNDHFALLAFAPESALGALAESASMAAEVSKTKELIKNLLRTEEKR